MKKRSAFVVLPVLALLFVLAPTAALGQYGMRRIVLDAGHGGEAPGCTGGGFLEKDIVLDIALRVGALLEQQQPDLEVIYTRKTDVNVGLQERAALANRSNADLFVSIHADAVEAASPRGSSTWVMGVAGERANLELAMRENSVITYEADYRTKYENFDPADPASYLKFALMQEAYLDQSIDLAALFQRHYGRNTSIATSRGVKQAGFLVLNRTTMPAVLTEIGFLSNAADRRYMTSEAGKAAIARSIAEAIGEYRRTIEENSRVVAGVSEGAPAPAVTPAVAQPQPVEHAPESAARRVVFRVQVSASRTPVAIDRFGRWAAQVTERRIDNYYKYFVGETNSYSDALSLQRRVRGTFADAFVVAFRDGVPTALTDEMKREL